VNKTIRLRDSGQSLKALSGHVMSRVPVTNRPFFDPCLLPCHSVPSVDNKLLYREHTNCLGVIVNRLRILFDLIRGIRAIRG
jgi:hypothetical protein